MKQVQGLDVLRLPIPTEMSFCLTSMFELQSIYPGMKSIYPSKFGWEIFLPMSITFLAVSGLLVAQSASWLGLGLVLITFVLILYAFLNTRYTIENNSLTIACGILYRKQIDIHAITGVRETNNILSSPATSLDRLEIRWGKDARVMVSPKDKSGFVSHLQSIKPGINYTKDIS